MLSGFRAFILVIAGCLQNMAQIRCCCDMGTPGTGGGDLNYEVSAFAWYR